MILELLAFGPALGSRWAIAVSVEFDGFLPILGGREAKVKVEMDVDLSLSKTEPLTAVTDILKLKAILNGAPLPLDAKTTTEFFPKTTVQFSGIGEVIKSDAPDKKLPVNLPGLDSKRFPDVSYLPIQWPGKEAQIGVPFEFDKVFNGSKVHYRVTPESINIDTVVVKVELSQQLRTFEDLRANPVSEETAAVIVDSKLVGSGSGVFSRKTGLFETFRVEAISEGTAVDKSGAARKPRKLKTILSIRTGPKL